MTDIAIQPDHPSNRDGNPLERSNVQTFQPANALTIVSIVGARPQFIKAAPVSRELRQHHHEILVHTGQHYDDDMSAVFFQELDIPEPDHNLGVGSGPHGRQTGQMLERIERVLLEQQPEWVLVYGDTNSTLAGALAAVKLHIPVAHVEAGLRSFNRRMPEEHNRVLTDHCADLLLCPTQVAVDNLAKEGIMKGVHLVGDVMHDAVRYNAEIARQRSTILEELGLDPGGYLLATVHRPYNVDAPETLESILNALAELDETVVFPAHPRTRQRMADFNLTQYALRNTQLVNPVSYLDMLMLEQHARMILTDSGGVQKEAYWCGVPCLTLRPETEWVETVEAGWNRLLGTGGERIVEAVSGFQPPEERPELFGDGTAAEQLVRLLEEGRSLHPEDLETIAEAVNGALGARGAR